MACRGVSLCTPVAIAASENVTATARQKPSSPSVFTDWGGSDWRPTKSTQLSLSL